MATAIHNRGDASALVPIVLQVAGEHVDKVKHVKFWTDLDEHAIELRNEAIRRLALGMDMPPEVLEGQADLNHWSSWQVEEAAIKSHTEPLLAIITSSLTDGYLIPYLLSEGMTVEEAQSFAIGADTAGMRVRPNRSEEAMELYDRGLLGTKALLRENGFDPETDLMGGEELQVWFLRKVALGQTTPDIVAEALRALDIPISGTPVTEAPDDRPAVHEARPIPSLEDHPDRGAPSVSEENDNLTASSMIIVDRAIERAGNRLRTQMGRKLPGVSAFATYRHVGVMEDELDDLLKDAWSTCDRYAAQFGVDADRWGEALDQYTRVVLTSQRAVDPKMLALHLRGVR